MKRFASALPNIFYDLIVFISPSILLILGILIGTEFWPYLVLRKYNISIGAINFLVIILGFIFLGYEYGRLAETISCLFIADPIRYLSRRKLFFKNPDYCAFLEKEVDSINIPSPANPNKRGSKWAIYFYALYVLPNIGQDLLKRHAWEKLARSSAFTYFILFFFSVVSMLLNNLNIFNIQFAQYGFNSTPYLLATFVLVLFTSYEYYQRNCWNNDLLCKVIPVLIAAGFYKDLDSEQ
jgi:hypothetical protein